MNLYKIYGIVAGLVSIFIGVVLLYSNKLDTILSDNETTADRIRKQRFVIGTLIILAGIMSLSAVLFGWPHVRGYIVPPP